MVMMQNLLPPVELIRERICILELLPESILKSKIILFFPQPKISPRGKNHQIMSKAVGVGGCNMPFVGFVR
jgi:hypothetical protein